MRPDNKPRLPVYKYLLRATLVRYDDRNARYPGLEDNIAEGKVGIYNRIVAA